jgi:hypothetical protein
MMSFPLKAGLKKRMMMFYVYGLIGQVLRCKGFLYSTNSIVTIQVFYTALTFSLL